MALPEYEQHTGGPVKKIPAEHLGTMHPAADSGVSSDEDSLALLPRHTVVQIVGNNRTKAAYIGLKAVVKRAQGLGGWHFLVLPNGEEIKLQRNALLVLELPTGNEQDFSEGEHEEEQRRQLAEQQQRQRQLQRQQQMEALELAEETRSRQRRAPRPLIADEYAITDRPQAPKALPLRQLHQPRINLGKLDVAALKRYRTYYRLPEPGAGSSKDDLVSLVAQHFAEQTVDEAEVISHFLRAARKHSAGGLRH